MAVYKVDHFCRGLREKRYILLLCYTTYSSLMWGSTSGKAFLNSWTKLKTLPYIATGQNTSSITIFITVLKFYLPLHYNFLQIDHHVLLIFIYAVPNSLWHIGKKKMLLILNRKNTSSESGLGVRDSLGVVYPWESN